MNNLAINGGKPVCNEKWLDWPVINNDFIDSIQCVVKNKRWAVSGYWTGRESFEKSFAEKFAKLHNVSYCVPVTSGSSALLIALEALDIGLGDEIIIPALTWVATATAVMNVNAKPVLVDVDPKTYCIDPDEIEKAISKRTKAIIAVHLFGCMCDMDRIMEIAKKYDLKVIEDNAQTHFSMWGNDYAGTIGDIGTFSFQQGKILTSGEGGAVLTKDKKLYNRLQQLKSDGRLYIENGLINFGFMDIEAKGEVFGCNYNLSEIQAAMLLNQMDLVQNQNNTRFQNAAYLDEKLSGIDGISIMEPYSKNKNRTYYGYIVKFDNTKFGKLSGAEIARLLQAELLLGSFFLHAPYLPINKTPLFCPWKSKRYLPEFAKNEQYWRSLQYPISESASESAVFFQHSVLLNKRENLDAIIESFKKIKAVFAT
jgi:L-glutamine:2-deoxy-scyllo-inosose/3-amino-2,3-dideoxy-scyllo-inosose aminotransferase